MNALMIIQIYFQIELCNLTNPGMVPSHGFSPRSYFFDNPRRYDSDDDLAWNIAPQGLQGGEELECMRLIATTAETHPRIPSFAYLGMGVVCKQEGDFAPDYYDWGQQTNSFLAQAGTLQDSALDPDKPRLG
ncbi:hypothetical protein P7K49_035431 [Saguinus oedipus]|uniref:Uncharacterized protein n=1 Tax=Saguinus oedipus TaxID=9490 RepID=A0ABQ9TMM6_SAGOE|nr:hypothetical protein P7K49_035431 [Saguinus oedipus]